MIKEKIPELQVVLKGESLGDVSTLDDVVDFIDQNHMGNWVRIVPFVDDIRTLHGAADVLVLCSDREALGRCIVEAMCMAKAVVVSDSGGSHEIVSHEETGLVFPGGAARALTDCLIRLRQEPDLRAALGERARRYAREHLDAQLTADRVTQIYRSIFTQDAAGIEFREEVNA